MDMIFHRNQSDWTGPCVYISRILFQLFVYFEDATCSGLFSFPSLISNSPHPRREHGNVTDTF